MLTWAVTFSLSWISDIRILRLPFWLLSIAYDIRGRVRLCANLKISNSIFNFSWEDSMYSNLTVLPPSHLSPECQMYNHVYPIGDIFAASNSSPPNLLTQRICMTPRQKSKGFTKTRTCSFSLVQSEIKTSKIRVGEKKMNRSVEEWRKWPDSISP